MCTMDPDEGMSNTNHGANVESARRMPSESPTSLAAESVSHVDVVQNTCLVMHTQVSDTTYFGHEGV